MSFPHAGYSLTERLPEAMNKNTPLISVIVPIHNGANLVEETLKSIFNQTLADFEVILVDDASTDSLHQVLARYRDERLRVVHLKSNVGVANARNEGVVTASGQYIAFCDADDICHPLRFERQIAYLQQSPQLGLCGTAFTCFSGKQDLETIHHPVADEEIKVALMTGNCFGMSTVMGKANLFKSHSFDQAMSPSEDYDLWTRLASAGVRMSNLSESLLRYRVHPSQASQQKSSQLDRLSRKIRAIYCARLLANNVLVEKMELEKVQEQDLDLAAEAIGNYCLLHPSESPRQFRFMLAWLYQKLPFHGIRSWWHWKAVQARLSLKLDPSYQLNIALLAWAPFPLNRPQIEVLLKLKR